MTINNTVKQTYLQRKRPLQFSGQFLLVDFPLCRDRVGLLGWHKQVKYTQIMTLKLKFVISSCKKKNKNKISKTDHEVWKCVCTEVELCFCALGILANHVTSSNDSKERQ